MRFCTPVFCVAAALGVLQALPTAQAPAFEAVSIKPTENGKPMTVFRDGPELYARPGINLYLLIDWAYDVPAYHIDGGPGWATTTFWEVTAKAAPNTTAAQVRQMVQHMLESRFKLKAHTEQRMAPAFELAPVRQDGRLGPNLTRSAVDCEPVIQKREGLELALIAACRTRGSLSSSRQTAVTMRGVALTRLAAVLRGAARGPITVHPQLQAGRFDVALVYQHDAFRSLLSDNSEVPSLTDALRDQLGLRLNRTETPTMLVVIDSAERPTPN